MKTDFASRMRYLRLKNKNTQEQLALHLGVTAQAVSKWERGENLPDITTLPDIAAFYNVTTDHLLGVDENEQKEKLEEYMTREKSLLSDRSVSERVALWRKAYTEFPNETTVLHRLIFALRAENLEENALEIITLSKQLLEQTKLSGEYFGAINNISRAFASQGNMDEAMKYAAMAGRYIGTENQILIHILKGERAVQVCQWNIETLVDLISVNAAVMLKKGNFTPQEKIKIANNIIDLFVLIIGDTQLGFYHSRLFKWHLRLGKYNTQLGKIDEAIRSLERAFEHAVAFDKATDGTYNSPMLTKYKYRIEKNGESLVAEIIESLDDSCFDKIRDNNRFKVLLDRIRSSCR